MDQIVVPFFLFFIFLGISMSSVFAQDILNLSPGDTGWVLMSSVLVSGMIVPGIALLYGEMVHSKNALSTMIP